MKRPAAILAVLTAFLLLPGCHRTGQKTDPASVLSFWEGTPLLEEDYNASEERFADFAELAVSAPEEEALAAMDGLFDRLREEGDEVTYYIYAAWMDAAFYDILSPCRNEPLFARAVDRMESDGILPPADCVPYREKCRWMALNRPGEQAAVPEADPEGRNTLVLVLDLSCPSCRESLRHLSAMEEWADARHLALCCGYGPVPDIEGWEYRKLEDAAAYFDIHMTPCYYIIDGDGVVLHPYAPVN